ncbi:hypothetical protein DMB42_24650 [Nonomuraea sp. WAC 01424]|nr:hypothetical protein DMB42_24650 [Nonomuraea sp. WAC 01424]
MSSPTRVLTGSRPCPQTRAAREQPLFRDPPALAFATAGGIDPGAPPPPRAEEVALAIFHHPAPRHEGVVV